MLLHSDRFSLAAGTDLCDFMSKNVCPVRHAEKMFHLLLGNGAYSTYLLLKQKGGSEVNFSPSFVYQQLSLSVCECVWVIMYTHINYSGTVHCFQCIKLLWKKLLSMEIWSSEMRNWGTEKLGTIFSPFWDIYSGWAAEMRYLNEILRELLQSSFYRMSWTKHSKQWRSRSWIELSCLLSWYVLYLYPPVCRTGQG